MFKTGTKSIVSSLFSNADFGLILKIGVVLFAVISLFLVDFCIIFADAFQSEVFSYMLLIPIIFVYMIYRKRKLLKAVSAFSDEQPVKMRRLFTVAGILMTILAVLIYWWGSYTFTPVEYHMVALPIFVAGLVSLFFNIGTLRQLLFPIFFLFFLMSLQSGFLYVLGGALSNFSSAAANFVVNALGISSMLDNQYGSPLITVLRSDGSSINFLIDVAGSGIYSIIGFAVFASLIAFIIRDKFWKKTVVMFLGLPIIILLNVGRIITLILIGYTSGESLILDLFHFVGGWVLIFLGAFLLFLISEKILKTKVFAKKVACPQCDIKPRLNGGFCVNCGRIMGLAQRLSKFDIVKIGVVVVGVVIILSAVQAPVFALAQKPAIVLTEASGQQTSIDILPDISDYNLQFMYRDSEFEKDSHIDVALSYQYVPKTNEVDPVWVSLEIDSVSSSLHRWETYLVDYPLQRNLKSRVAQIELSDIQISEAYPTIGRYFVFKYVDTNLTQAVLYFYESAAFTINSVSEQKYVKLSLISYPEDDSELLSAKNRLSYVAGVIADYWQPVKTWSSVAFIVSQNGVYFIALVSVFELLVIALYVVEGTHRRNVSRNAYQKLSAQNKQLIDIIQSLEKTGKSTLSDITSAFQLASDEPANVEQVLHKLVELEKIGILSRQIANRQDEPICVWKTNLKSVIKDLQVWQYLRGDGISE